MKILVTGGAGFIGSHLTAALVSQEHAVTVFDNLSTGKRANLAGLPVTFVEGDVADFDTLARAVEGCELLFHQAAMVSVPRSIDEPDLNHRSNVTGTFHVFEAARQAGVRRVVYASSAAIYGDEPTLPKRETSVIAPLTPYGAAKYMAEVYATAYAASYPEMEFVGLRYMNVFGPRQDPSSPYSGVLSIFCQAVLNGRSCTIFGDGEQTRDFVYVSDVVQANLLAATVPLDGGAEVFNIGRGAATSLNQIVAVLDQLTLEPVKVTYAPARHGDIRHSVADISRAQTALGYSPEVTVVEGLRATLDWFSTQNGS
ncbi:MAG: SDR family oxidoreductase [Chloroflexota bacterium]|nr:SDR family oxidoreductase [Chloroflexota bacterium]